MNQSYYIASGKGGTGKSVVAVNLAATLALLGRNTLLIDMNPGLRTLDILLNVEFEAIYHAFDVMNGVCTLEQAVVRIEEPGNLYLLPGGLLEDRKKFDNKKWEALLSETKEEYDCIVIDGVSGISDYLIGCAKEADETIIVTTPEATALRNGDMLEDQLIRNRILQRRYLINRMKPDLIQENLELDAKEIDRQFKCEILGMILEDDSFRLFADAGIPIVLKEDSYISGNFRKIAQRLIQS